MRTLSFEPLISPTLWITLAIALAAVLAWYGWHRAGGIGRARWGLIVALMAAAGTLVLAILLNPTWIEPVPAPPGKALLTVLVDSSSSMAAPDSQQTDSRYQAATQVARTLAERLARQFEVQIRSFSDAVAPSNPADLAGRTPDGTLTDFAPAIRESIAQDRPQGQAIVLLSDGIQTAPGGVAGVLKSVQLAKAMSVPIYTRTFGGEAGRWDVGVELRSPQQLSYIRQKVPVAVQVTHVGLPGKRANVSLVYEGKTVETRQALLRPDGSTELRFTIEQEKPGLYSYEVRVEPIVGEITAVNNSAPLLLHVVDKPIRILLLEGKPYWDLKFLMRTLSADPAVALDSVVRLAPNRFLRRSLGVNAGATQPAAPADAPREEVWKIVPESTDALSDAAALGEYQVVVLGRDAEIFLTDAAVANLRQWVARQGGSLVCYRGSPAAQVNDQLARLLPVRWSPRRESRFHMKLTSHGQDLRWLGQDELASEEGVLAQLPTLATSAEVGKPGPLAVVLATSLAPGGDADAPVMSYQPYGTGRVVVIEGAGMWRWAFLAPAYQQLDHVYNTLWQSLLRWLVSSVALLPGQDLSLRADRLTFSTGEPAVAMLVMREQAARRGVPQVELYRGRDRLAQISPVPVSDQPGAFRVVFGKLGEGHYTAAVAGRDDSAGKTVFDVKSPLKEQLELRARPELMERIAADSGGAVLASGAPGELSDRFATHMAAAHPQRFRRTTAWDRTWVLLAALGLWAISWGLRRKSGLV